MPLEVKQRRACVLAAGFLLAGFLPVSQAWRPNKYERSTQKRKEETAAAAARQQRELGIEWPGGDQATPALAGVNVSRGWLRGAHEEAEEEEREVSSPEEEDEEEVQPAVSFIEVDATEDLEDGAEADAGRERGWQGGKEAAADRKRDEKRASSGRRRSSVAARERQQGLERSGRREESRNSSAGRRRSAVAQREQEEDAGREAQEYVAVRSVAEQEQEQQGGTSADAQDYVAFPFLETEDAAQSVVTEEKDLEG